jgi:hypothetical protein
MAEKHTSLAKELERLRARAAPPDYLGKKRDLFLNQAGELARLLRPSVERHLSDEAAGDVADEWLQMAKGVLASLAGESGAPLRDRPRFDAAAALVRKELNDEFLRKALRPSAEEIESHTAELAQCVLGNWFSLLEHAKQDAGKAVALTPVGAPQAAPIGALWEGIDAFAVPQGEVADAFKRFFDASVAKGVQEIAPSLYLASRGADSFVAGSLEEANRIAAPPPQPQRPRPKPLGVDWLFPVPAKYQEAYQAMSEILHPRLEATIASMDEEMEQIVATAAALDITASRPLHLLGEDEAELVEELADGKLAGQLADYTLVELDHLVHPKRFRAPWKKPALTRLVENEAKIAGGGIYGPMCRMTVLATGLAASGAVKKIDYKVDQAKLRAYMRKQPQAQKYFVLVRDSTRAALAQPKAGDLGHDIRRLVPGLDV